MQNIKKRLQVKGWEDKDIYHALSIFYKAESNKSNFHRILDKSIFWLIFMGSLAMIVVISISLLPVLIVLKGFILYLTVSVIALGFGYFFEIILRNIQKLEGKHHLLINLSIPLSAILTFFFIVKYSNNLEIAFKITNPHNPYLLGGVYSLSFLLPYFYYLFKGKYHLTKSP